MGHLCEGVALGLDWCSSSVSQLRQQKGASSRASMKAIVLFCTRRPTTRRLLLMVRLCSPSMPILTCPAFVGAITEAFMLSCSVCTLETRLS